MQFSFIYQNSVSHDIKAMYDEWIRNGETKEDISECYYVNVYWEKTEINIGFILCGKMK